jgi:hypothetical protein
MWAAVIRWLFKNKLNTRPTIRRCDEKTSFDPVRHQFESECG